MISEAVYEDHLRAATELSYTLRERFLFDYVMLRRRRAQREADLAFAPMF